MGDRRSAEKGAIKQWYDQLVQRDAKLHGEIERRLNVSESSIEGARAAPAFETVSRAPISPDDISFETLVQVGRPALFVLGDRIDKATPLHDDASALMVGRVMEAGDKINPWLPLIGRIDVENHPAGFPYVGTGWLIQSGLVCTNRHVAELIGRRDGRTFTFSRGRFNRPLGVSFNRRREKYPDTTSPEDAFMITDIAWIEPADGPDLALLRVEMAAGDGSGPTHLAISDKDGSDGDFVVTIGYPARAYEDTIPDQLWMDEIYEGIYDVKRAAPGQLHQPAEGSTTYDCTTLGGASGSPVIDLASGKVVALHFAGLYKIENYGVPAATLRKYTSGVPSISEAPTAAQPAAIQPAETSVPALGPATARPSLTWDVPLRITLSLDDGADIPIASLAPASAPLTLDAAIARLAAEGRGGVLAVKRGFDGLGDCIIVAVAPESFAALRTTMPASYLGHRRQVRFATIEEQLGISALATEGPSDILYDDTRRTGAAFSFDTIIEEMEVIAHVGPEQSFDQLKTFIDDAEQTLTSSMYQFFSPHVAEAVEGRLKAGVGVRLVLDPATRDPKSGLVKDHEFDRSETFARWRSDHDFDNLYVRKGNGGLVSTAYHIKVTVRDREHVWLSSGNWTRSSQPFPDPQTHRATGNREWHIVARSERLATMFRAHIEADLEQCKELGPMREAPEPREPMVDVPIERLVEAPAPAPPALKVSGPVKVMPILTPDRRGRVYTDAVLDLIRSARDQLLFQNQYIKIREGMTGNLSDLVDALVKQSHRIRDTRVILRSGDIDDDISELRRRGLDVMRCVRVVSNTHTKGIVADGARVLVGSQNWSSDAVTINRDASLLFDNEAIAGHFGEVFEIDWMRARPPVETATESPRRPVLIAQGEAPPPGYTRMTLSEYRNG